jgi:hypothetical protein
MRAKRVFQGRVDEDLVPDGMPVERLFRRVQKGFGGGVHVAMLSSASTISAGTGNDAQSDW